MFRNNPRSGNSTFPDLRFAFAPFAFALLLLGCAKQPVAKHYALHGKVMSIDKRGNELIIDHDAIPGFMGAMTMPYAVSDNSMLDKAAPGDEINADLKVQGDHVAIDRIDIVRKAGSAPAPITHIHFPQNGREGAEFCAHESKRQAHSDEA